MSIAVENKYRLSPLSLGSWSCGLLFFFFIGIYFLKLPPLVFILLPLGLMVLSLAARFGEIALYIFILNTVLFNFRLFEQSSTSSVTPVQVAAALVILGLAIIHVVKIKLLQRGKLFGDNTIMLVILSMCWTFLISIFGIIVEGHRVEIIIREIVLQLPLVMCPLFILHSINSSNEKRVFIFIIIMWALTLATNFIKYQSNIARAYYLYEVGRATIDITLASLALFTFAALASYRRSVKKPPVLLLLGSVVSIAGIAISMYRTLWLTDMLLMIALIFFFSKKDERKKGMSFMAYLTILVSVILLVAILFSPLVQLIMRLFFERFLYSSAVTTDPSLVNRYIEWKNILGSISSSFLTGIGYGGQFLNYNWILGVSYMTGYTHNGYLFLLLRGGIIGFVLLGAGYILFIQKAMKLIHSHSLSIERRAFLKGGLMILIGNLFVSLTVNALAQREALLWTGIIWGFILLSEREIRAKLQ